MTNTTVFEGTPSSAAQLQPWIAPAHPAKQGMPLGRDLRTSELVTFDPWLWKVDDVLHSTVFNVYGQKGSGKSTLLKALIARLTMLQAGHIDGVPQRMRVRINDRKPEDGQPEYTPLTNFLGCEVVPLSSMKVNMFDSEMNMSEWDLLETAINICEFVRGGPLTGLQPLALQIAVSRMLQGGTPSSPELLEHILQTIDMSDVNEYYHGSKQTLLDTLDRSSGGQLDELQTHLQNIAERSHNVSQEELQRDALLVSTYFGRILRGDYGQIFGGERSLRDVLSQPALTLDWTGVNPKAATVLQSLLWKWQTVALNHNDLSLIPHIDVGDEEHESMTSLMYLRFMAAYVKKARAFHTAIFRATQFPLDYQAIGDEGSEMRGLATNILQGIGGEFIGKQPSTHELQEYWYQAGVSETEWDAITRLPMGCFGMKIPDRRITFFQFILTETDWQFVQSNAAAHRMTGRIPFDQSVGKPLQNGHKVGAL